MRKARTFATGATRDAAHDKPDYAGFLSEYALPAYAAYMHKHRVQSDGELRASDNWKKGIPKATYLSSLWRHVIDLWCIHLGITRRDVKDESIVTVEDAASGILFNAFGYLHEHLKEAAQKKEKK